VTHWLRSCALLLRWQYLRVRSFLIMLSAIQVLLAVGVVYGLSYLIPNIDPTTALYLATGAPTLGLLVLGLNVVPQEVSQARVAGRADYVKALPVPRLAPLASEVTFWLLVQFPGTVLSLVIASVRFDIDFQVGWMVAPAILLVALSAASVGYAIAVTLSPEVTNQVTAFVSIAILLFSPINFPAEQLPSALQRIHDVLPVQYMADVVRGSLTGQYSDSAAVAFSVVAAWCAAGLAVSYRAATRRG
jgi:ABC-2 type transport system permease protein